ncbi:hypothetical protein ILUMI_19933, partial [Ignelater luminosus]
SARPIKLLKRHELALKRATSRVIPAQLNMENTMKGLVLPEDILRPYPKGQARKDSNRGRPKGRCTTATDTPEKMLIEEKKKMPIKRRLFKVKSSSFEDEENCSVHSENSQIDWVEKSSDKEEPREGNVDVALEIGWQLNTMKTFFRSK